MLRHLWPLKGDSADWQGDIDGAVAWENRRSAWQSTHFHPLHPSPSLLIPIEKGKGRTREAAEDGEEEGSDGAGQRLR